MEVWATEQKPSHALFRRLMWSLVFVVIATAGGLFLVAHPPMETNFYPACVLHQLTGWHCPGCGGTRCVHALLHLRYGEALRMNAIAALALPVLGFIGVRSWWRWLLGRPAGAALDVKPWHAWVIVAVLITFGVVRNLPWEPFTWLAPE
jgi:hypothetical protein